MWCITADFRNPSKPVIDPGIVMCTEHNMPYGTGMVKIGNKHRIKVQEHFYAELSEIYIKGVVDTDYLNQVVEQTNCKEVAKTLDTYGLLKEGFSKIYPFKLFKAQHVRSEYFDLLKEPKNNDRSLVIRLLVKDTDNEKVWVRSKNFNKTLIKYHIVKEIDKNGKRVDGFEYIDHLHTLDKNDYLTIDFKGDCEVSYTRYKLVWTIGALQLFHEVMNRETNEVQSSKLIHEYDCTVIIANHQKYYNKACCDLGARHLNYDLDLCSE